MAPFRSLLAASLLVYLAGCGGGGGGGNTDPGQAPPTNTVSGTVTFKGNPVQGAQVTVFDTNWNRTDFTATTDASGHYSVSGLMATSDVPAEFLLWAALPGYGFWPAAGSPGQVVRTGQNMIFADNGNIGMGLDVSAVQYVSTVAGGSLAGADFTAYDGSNPRVQLGRTGQTASYAAGDDGAVQAGVAWSGSRFTDRQDGTVTDNLTGLTWLKDAGALGAATWSQALTTVNQLASGSAGLSDGSTPGTWRLPNANELESVVDLSSSGPALTAGNPFRNVSDAYYWTSTPVYGGEIGSSWAYVIRMTDGSWIDDGRTNAQTASCAVWAVKGGAGGAIALPATGFHVPYQAGDDGTLQLGVGFPSPRFLDNGDGTVTDTLTGLVWLKRADAIDLPWAQAVAAVNGLASGQYGLSDGSSAGQWRMPNRRELLSLGDRMQSTCADYFDFDFVLPSGLPFQAPIFSDFVTGQFYWTSSTTAADPTQAWTVFSCDFIAYPQAKANPGYTLAVRGR
jgi:hypothetical protein